MEEPVVMDGATEITAEGGIGAASRSTLGLIGSSRMTKHQRLFYISTLAYVSEFLASVHQRQLH